MQSKPKMEMCDKLATEISHTATVHFPHKAGPTGRRVLISEVCKHPYLAAFHPVFRGP